jgi:hypothetical protein
MHHNITALFCFTDDFCKAFEAEMSRCQLSQNSRKPTRIPGLTNSEIMAILLMFQTSYMKNFSGIAARGKSTMGWFFGFKLHLVIDRKGEIKNAMLTAGNADDRKPVEELVSFFQGRIFGDRGYI